MKPLTDKALIAKIIKSKSYTFNDYTTLFMVVPIGDKRKLDNFHFGSDIDCAIYQDYLVWSFKSLFSIN